MLNRWLDGLELGDTDSAVGESARRRLRDILFGVEGS